MGGGGATGAGLRNSWFRAISAPARERIRILAGGLLTGFGLRTEAKVSWKISAGGGPGRTEKFVRARTWRSFPAPHILEDGAFGSAVSAPVEASGIGLGSVITVCGGRCSCVTLWYF